MKTHSIFPRIIVDPGIPEGTILCVGSQLVIKQVRTPDGKVVAEWYEGLEGCAVIKNVGTEPE